MIGRPPMPAALLAPEARKEWRRIVPEVEAMGLLTVVDRGVLVRYCNAWAEWVDLNARINVEGYLVKGRDRGYVRNPLWLMRSNVEAVLADLGRQLGLTPAARLRAGVAHEKPKPVEEAAAPPKSLDDYRARADV